MKYFSIFILIAFALSCGNENKTESTEPATAAEPAEAIATEEADTKDQYYDYAEIDEVLEIEVDNIICEYIANSIVSCDIMVTNPNDVYLYDLFLTFYPVFENNELGEQGISQMSGGHYKIAPGEQKEISAVLTTFSRDAEYLRFTFDTNEKPYESDIEDFDVDQIKSL